MAVSLIRRVFVGVVLCAWMVLGHPFPALAQSRNTAEVSGVVRDASGGVLPGAWSRASLAAVPSAARPPARAVGID
jgi:hypothetical protein